MKLTSLTHLAFLTNRIIDAEPDTDPSFREIFVAACDGELIKLLASSYGHLADFSLLLSEPSLLEQMEAAIRDAGSAFDSHGDKPTGPHSGLCLVMDIVIEAIQQQFHSSPPRPRQAEPDQQFSPSLDSGNHRSPLKLSVFLQLAFIINSLADSPSETELPFSEVHAAAREGRLLPVLGHYAGRFPDFSFFESPPRNGEALRAALREASVALESREFVKAGVCRNGYCLALAIVLEAARQSFPGVPAVI